MADDNLFRQISGNVDDLKQRIDNLTGSFTQMNSKIALIEKVADKFGSIFENLTSTFTGFAIAQNDVLEIFTKYSRSVDELSRSSSSYFTSADRLNKILVKTSQITNLSKQDILKLVDSIDHGLVGPRNFQGLDSLINRVAMLGKTAQQSQEIMESLVSINSKFGTGITSGISQLTTKEISQLSRKDITNALQFQYATPEVRQNKYAEMTARRQQIESTKENRMLGGAESFAKTLMPIAEGFGNTLGQLNDATVGVISAFIGLAGLDWGLKRGKGLLDTLTGMGKNKSKQILETSGSINPLTSYKGGIVPVEVVNFKNAAQTLLTNQNNTTTPQNQESNKQTQTTLPFMRQEQLRQQKLEEVLKQKPRESYSPFRRFQKGMYEEKELINQQYPISQPNLYYRTKHRIGEAIGSTGELAGKFGTRAFNNIKNSIASPKMALSIGGAALGFDQIFNQGKVTSALTSGIGKAFEGVGTWAAGEKNRGAVKTGVGILGSMSSGAMAGGMMGTIAGPYGIAAGAIAGAGIGLYKGLSENKAKAEKEQNKLIDDRQDKLDKLNKDVENSLKSNKNDYNTIKKLVNEYNSGLKSGEEHLSAQQIVLQQLTDSMQQTLITAERIKEVSSERASIFQGLQEYYTTESINPAKAVAVSKEMVIARNKEIQADTIANNKRLELYSQMKQMGIGSYKEIENEITTYQKLVTETDAKIKTSTESDKTKLEQLKESYKSQLKLAEQNKKTVQEGAKNFNINPDTLVDTEASTLTAKNAKNQLEALKNIFQYEMANIAPLQERQQITTNIAQLQERLSETARLGMGAEYGAIVNTASNLQKELNISLQSLKQMGDSANYWQKQIQSGQYNTQEIAAINDHINKLTIESYRQQGKALEDQQKIFEKMSTLREKYVSALPEMSIGVNFELDPTQAMGLTSLMGPGSGSFLVGGNRGGGLGYTAGGSTWGGSAFSGRAPWNAYKQMPWGPGPAVASPSGLQSAGASFMGNRGQVPWGGTFKKGGFIPGNENEPKLIQAHGDEYVLSSDNVDKFNKIIGEDSGGGGKDYINEYINNEYNRKRIKGFKTGGGTLGFDFSKIGSSGVDEGIIPDVLKRDINKKNISVTTDRFSDTPYGKKTGTKSIEEWHDKLIEEKELKTTENIKDFLSMAFSTEKPSSKELLNIINKKTNIKQSKQQPQRRRPGKVNGPLWGIDIARANAIQQQKNQNLMGQHAWFMGMRGGSNIINSVGQSYGDSGYRKTVGVFAKGGPSTEPQYTMQIPGTEETKTTAKSIYSAYMSNYDYEMSLSPREYIKYKREKKAKELQALSIESPQGQAKYEKHKAELRKLGENTNYSPYAALSDKYSYGRDDKGKIISRKPVFNTMMEGIAKSTLPNKFVSNYNYNLNKNKGVIKDGINNYYGSGYGEKDISTQEKYEKQKKAISTLSAKIQANKKSNKDFFIHMIESRKLFGKDYDINKLAEEAMNIYNIEGNNVSFDSIIDEVIRPYQSKNKKNRKQIKTYSDGGITKGEKVTDDGGFLAVLHPKEVVLNERQIGNLNKQIGLTNQDFAKAGVPGFKNGGPTLNNNISTSHTSSSGHNHGSSIKSKILCHRCQSDLMGEISVETINSSLGLQDTGPSSIQSSYVL